MLFSDGIKCPEEYAYTSLCTTSGTKDYFINWGKVWYNNKHLLDETEFKFSLLHPGKVILGEAKGSNKLVVWK